MYSLVIGLAVIVAAPAPKDAKKPAPITLIGEWSIESAIVLGMPQPPDAATKTVRFNADGTTATLDGNGGIKDTSKFTHDAKASPAHLDMEKDGVKFAGIYKIEGETLTICLTFQGDRPIDFKADCKNVILFAMKRVKKD